MFKTNKLTKTPQMSLEKLIAGCVKRDTLAQEQIYRLYSGKMYALCLKYSRGKEEAEDNLQDAFIQIFDKVGQFKNKGSFEGWMKRIVINTALQKYRDKKVLNIVHEQIEEEEVMIEVDEDDISLDYLLKLVQELPNQYRLVFNLYVLDGYSHKEISDELHISEGTSKSNLSRARAILKKRLEERAQDLRFFRIFS
jgi:RNA polymerase sigma-70 factor (ECF subfamily)